MSFAARACRATPLSRLPAPLARVLKRLYVEEVVAALAFAAFLVTFSAQALLAHDFKVGAIEIDHPWTRATPDGANVAAGYMVLKNSGTTADHLVAGTLDGVQKVEIHEMAMKDGVMIMRPVTGGVEIPASGSAMLKPGSYHVMFIGLAQPLKQGTKVNGTLTFEKAGTVQVQYVVEALAAQNSGHDHGAMPATGK
jgi:copper(I)-binding protein